jgi:hypothetical protein
LCGPVLPVRRRYYRWPRSNFSFDFGRAVVPPRYFRLAGTTGTTPVLPAKYLWLGKKGAGWGEGELPLHFLPVPNTFFPHKSTTNRPRGALGSLQILPLSQICSGGIISRNDLLQWHLVLSSFSHYFGLILSWILGRR